MKPITNQPVIKNMNKVLSRSSLNTNLSTKVSKVQKTDEKVEQIKEQAKKNLMSETPSFGIPYDPKDNRTIVMPGIRVDNGAYVKNRNHPLQIDTNFLFRTDPKDIDLKWVLDIYTMHLLI